MNVLVLGGAGFVGTVLIPDLLEKGYKVKLLDNFYYGKKPIESFKDEVEITKADIRTVKSSVFKNIDVAINLAAIAQPDQREILDPQLFYEINHKACARVAKLSKEEGVERFIWTSTNSVYGFQEDIVDEESEPNPLEAYGKSKLLAEADTLSLADDNFIVSILRPATMYGVSPKMRYDLVVNGMTWALQEFGKINVMRDGNQWRSNVHVKDVSRAILALIKGSPDKIQKEIFNIGSNEQNYQILPLAKLIGDSVGVPYELNWYGETDKRSYRVDFTKITERLGFHVKHDVPNTAKELYNALEQGIVPKTEKTSVINWCDNLVKKGKLSLIGL